VWLILVFDVLKSKKASIVLGFFTILIFFLIEMAILIPPLLDILTKLFPSVFTKFRTVSFFSRFYSLTYGFKIFARSPLFGVGPVTARELFFELTKSDGITVDAFTSTLGTLAASYGFIGILIYLFPIVGLIYNKKLSFYQKVLLALFYFLTTLQESQVEIFMISIFYLIFGIFGLTELIKKCHHKQIFCLDDNKKCLLNLFFCKNEKGNVTLNIAINIVVKFLALLIGFITISIYSDYFGNKNAYGIWLSMISISTWILQLDFGFGNSLRNKLTEARVKNDKAKEQSIISSTYAVTFLMTVIWIIISLILCNVLDLFSIFKASEEYVSSSVLKASVLIVLISIAVELSLRNITYILQVIGKSGIASSLTLISNILVLVFVSVARIEGEEKFIVLSLVYSIAILLPLLIASLIVFLKKKVPFINLKTINKESIRSVSKLGIGFFVVQLSNLFLWSLNDVLLINLLNKPDVVVDYTEYYKLFSAITGLAMVLQGPVWVGISSAKEKGDITKFKKYCKINLVFCVFLAVCSAILTLCLPVVFHIWLGDNTPSISIVYQVIMLMFAFVTCGYQYFGLICNGLGSVKAQVVVACIAVALKVPLTLLFNTFFGNTLQWSSVILSNTILISIYLFVLPISIKREVKKMKKNRSFESL
ncbi:MAG: oligosaccharide flippase family protein, partial [Clostridia bacterium]|nr:oligosaccharide flippase family protein [Clostridia bacterium]